MFKRSWKNWLMVAILLAVTNIASWNRQKIAELFEVEKLGGQVDIGVLVNDELLPGDKEENIAFARKYLSEDYHWLYLPDKYDGKVPVPWPPFSEGTGFHFRPVSKKQKPVPQLMARK